MFGRATITLGIGPHSSLVYYQHSTPMYVAILFALRGQTVMGQSQQPSVPVMGQSQPSVPLIGQSQPSGQLPVNVATTADLEHLKRELTTIMRSEIAAAKHDIVEGMSDALAVFTARCSYASAVLGVVILSVCLSVTRVLCD